MLCPAWSHPTSIAHQPAMHASHQGSTPRSRAVPPSPSAAPTPGEPVAPATLAFLVLVCPICSCAAHPRVNDGGGSGSPAPVRGGCERQGRGRVGRQAGHEGGAACLPARAPSHPIVPQRGEPLFSPSLQGHEALFSPTLQGHEALISPSLQGHEALFSPYTQEH